MFSKNGQKILKKLFSRYPFKKNALLPVLHLAQKENNGWLNKDWISHIAYICEVSHTHVEGVISFYTMFRLKAPGKFHLQICTCVPCCIMGGEKILKQTEKKLGIHNGSTTEDGIFSIEEMECIGACSNAPAIIVNEDYYENMNYSKLEQLINDLKKQN